MIELKLRDQKWNIRFLQMAKLVSGWSKDPSTQVGAVIVGEDRKVISVGYNGFPSAMPDLDEWYNNRAEKYSRVVHAEVNALITAGAVRPNSTLYTYPLMPCDRCVVQTLQAGILKYVSVYPTADAMGRWGESFAHTMKYIQECKGTYFLLNPDEVC